MSNEIKLPTLTIELENLHSIIDNEFDPQLVIVPKVEAGDCLPDWIKYIKKTFGDEREYESFYYFSDECNYIGLIHIAIEIDEED